MFLKTVNRGTLRRLVSTSATKGSTEAVSVSKRDDYYKNLGAQTYEDKPAGWDEALPFEAIPGPKPLPILGNNWRFLPYVGEYHDVPRQEFYKRLKDDYGNITVLKGLMGRKPSVLLFDSSDMETLFRNTGPYPIRQGLESVVYYRNRVRDDVFQGVGGVLTVQGEEWFKLRTMANPILMQPRVAQKYIGVMDTIASELIENINYFAGQNVNSEMPEDFIKELYKWSLESIGVVALNRRLGCLDRNLEKGSDIYKFIESVTKAIDLLYYIEILPSVWKIVSTPSWKKAVHYMNITIDTAVKYINETLAQPVDENVPDNELSVLHRLLKIDKKFAIAMVIDMLAAGIDTTGRTLGAALYFLAKNPEAQERLRAEALQNLPTKDSPITKEILNNSPYVKAVVKETTRMAPIALGNLRTTVKDLVLGGYRIPKDTEVMTMHIIPSLSDEFKDAEKFIPDRYLRSADDEYSYKNAHAFASLPFGFGPRSCIGKRLANLELEIALTKIMRNFKMSWPHEDMKFDATLIYGITDPLKIRVEPVKE